MVSGPRIMAVGRYERLGPDSPEAEVAFVVEDAHQGRGIGSVLLEHLADAARENGITRFVAEVLPENGGMLRVFSDFGYQIQRAVRGRRRPPELPDRARPRSPARCRSRASSAPRRGRSPGCSPRAAVAVYGASASGQGIGAAMLGHLRDGGYPGTIVPVHRRRGAGGRASRRTGRPAVAGVAIDLALIAVPPAGVADAVARRGGERGRRPGGGLGRLRRDRRRRRRRPARADRGGARGGVARGRPEQHGGGQRRPGRTAERHPGADAARGRPGRVLQPERRARRRPAGRGRPARPGPVQLRLGRQPGRRLRQRPAAVLAGRPGHRRGAALPGDVRQPAQVRPAGPPDEPGQTGGRGGLGDPPARAWPATCPARTRTR